MDLPTLRALAYAASLNQPVLALHVSPDEQDGERFRHYWNVWGDHVPLEVIVSPYRLITLPLVRYIRTLRARRPDLTITLVLPHVTVRHRWQRVLHNQTARRLRAALRQDTGVVVATTQRLYPAPWAATSAAEWAQSVSIARPTFLRAKSPRRGS